jgi:hypothetical protein
MAVVTSQVVGLNRVLARITAWREACSDLRPFWNEVLAPRYFALVQDGFALSGLKREANGQFVGGTRWAPLSPRYAAWKFKHFPGLPILTRSTELRESVRWTGSGLGPGGIWEPLEKSLRLGTSVRHASAHMKGRWYGGREVMPARRFMEAPDKATFAPLLKKHIRERAMAGGT